MNKHIKNSISNKIIVCTIFFVSMVYFGLDASARENVKITIDHNTKQLVAPEGNEYQWFYNGNKIEDAQQKQISIEESGEYTVILEDEAGIPVSQSITVTVNAGEIKKIFIIGDSTVCNYKDKDYPQAGWGQVLQLYFNKTKIEVNNHAIGGRSSKSFWNDGRWTTVVNLLDSGDYVFVQFGHNDRDWSKEERYTDTALYKDFMRIYVNETRAKGAIPVLISPMIMHAYKNNVLRNVFTEGSNDYRGAMLEIANELDVAFIDLNIKSYDLVKEVGATYATYFMFFGLVAGEYTNYPSGHDDFTHFQEMGALEMAGLITEGISEISTETGMSYLNDALTPLYNVTVETNNSSAGIITKSGKYPVGAKFTKKVKMTSSLTFKHWEDSTGNILTTDNLSFTTIEAKNYKFIASIVDCEGNPGGTALYDKCSNCTGGNTGLQACTSAIESEKGCIKDGTTETKTFNGIERTYINTNSKTNPGILYSLYAFEEGKYKFDIVYSGSTIDEKLDIYVNDKKVITSLNLDNTSEWNVSEIEIYLDKGKNKVRIESQSTTGGILYDLLANYSSKVVPHNSCIFTGINGLSNSSVVAYPNPFYESLNLQSDELINYSIYNTSGVIIEEGTCDGKCKIGVNIQKGLYLLHLSNDQGKLVQKIHKK